MAIINATRHGDVTLFFFTSANIVKKSVWQREDKTGALTVRTVHRNACSEQTAYQADYI